MALSSVASPIPLRLGLAEEFTRAREFFLRVGFDDTTLCRLLGMSDMSDVGQVGWEEFDAASGLSARACSRGAVPGPSAAAGPTRTSGLQPLETRDSARQLQLADPAALWWCLRTFVRGLTVSEEESVQACGKEVLEALLSLGLLRPAKKRAQALVCPVWVYPADEFVLASDRRADPEGDPFMPPPDVVFPAIYAGTLRFLRLLPEVVGGDALDLCGGSGIGGLHLARTARAVTADITERSTRFAEFNARLNGMQLECACGNLYEPLGGRQFDLVSAHPPFVPATGPNMVYRDGGETGEEITRRIIEGLPAHLRCGGTCVILCVARDTNEQTFEKRARSWLGTASREFDVVFGLEKVLSVEGVVESMRKRGEQISPEQARDLVVRLRSLSTRQFVYGALFLRRQKEPVQGEPLRMHLSPEGCAVDFEQVLAWRRHRRQPGFDAWLAAAQPRLAPGLELTVRHVVQDGQLVPAEFVFAINKGLQAALRPDAWVVPLIARLEGKQTVREVFEAASAADELPQGFALADFTGLVQGMIERGFLQVDFPGNLERSSVKGAGPAE